MIARQGAAKRMTILILKLCVYAVLIYGAVRFFEWKSVYHPTKEIREDPSAYGLNYEDVTLATEDDMHLHGWWVPHAESRGTIIMFHGNGGNIGGRAWLLPDLHSLGLNILLFDYRGYGRSEGIPTEKGTYRDAKAAYEFVREQYDGADNIPVILYGRSLGGAIAAECAVEEEVAGLILESTFASIKAMTKDIYGGLPVNLLTTFEYDTLGKIDRIDTPLLIAASRDDSMIPWQQGRKIFEAAREPKQWVQLSGDHNVSGWQSDPHYWKTLKVFVDSVL